ncbi:MAG: hypothetical protein PWR22_537 [Moorella sp. (in: firmicutes)]|jgi:hypothetical protein|nr:hypothetical protein [Moorella sp. (in: firmicutes)]MDK2894611.1 hypothetical protein [Moorella sp. (in: firmicutes)]
MDAYPEVEEEDIRQSLMYGVWLEAMLTNVNTASKGLQQNRRRRINQKRINRVTRLLRFLYRVSAADVSC